MEDGRYDEQADAHYGEWDDDPPRGTFEELAEFHRLLGWPDDPGIGLVIRPPKR
jgi:hypothetical protein